MKYAHIKPWGGAGGGGVPDPNTWERAKTAWKMRLEHATIKEIHKTTHLFNSEGSYSTFFRNSIYKGIYLFGGQVLKDFVPAMVTEEEWDSVQVIRQPRPEKGKTWKKQHPRRVSSPYLSTGLVYCADCGASMVSDYSGHGKTI